MDMEVGGMCMRRDSLGPGRVMRSLARGREARMMVTAKTKTLGMGLLLMSLCCSLVARMIEGVAGMYLHTASEWVDVWAVLKSNNYKRAGDDGQVLMSNGQGVGLMRQSKMNAAQR